MGCELAEAGVLAVSSTTCFDGPGGHHTARWQAVRFGGKRVDADSVYKTLAHGLTGACIWLLARRQASKTLNERCNDSMRVEERPCVGNRDGASL